MSEKEDENSVNSEEEEAAHQSGRRAHILSEASVLEIFLASSLSPVGGCQTRRAKRRNLCPVTSRFVTFRGESNRRWIPEVSASVTVLDNNRIVGAIPRHSIFCGVSTLISDAMWSDPTRLASGCCPESSAARYTATAPSCSRSQISPSCIAIGNHGFITT